MTVDEKAGVSPNRKQSISDLMQKYKIGEFFQKYTMILALVIVTIVFATWKGKEGMILLPSNLTGLIAENAYVFVLADGFRHQYVAGCAGYAFDRSCHRRFSGLLDR